MYFKILINAFWSSEEAIFPKMGLRKSKDLIELINLKKSIDFLKITPNIQKLRTFSVENFILNKKSLLILSRNIVRTKKMHRTIFM